MNGAGGGGGRGKIYEAGFPKQTVKKEFLHKVSISYNSEQAVQEEGNITGCKKYFWKICTKL
jgi:hypothetical protein